MEQCIEILPLFYQSQEDWNFGIICFVEEWTSVTRLLIYYYWTLKNC